MMFYLGTKREKFVFKFFPQSQVDSMFKQLNEKAFCQFPVRLDGEDYIIKICNVIHFNNYNQYKFMFIHDSDVLEFHSTSLIHILERFLIDVCEFEPDYPVEKNESEWKYYKKRSRIY